MVRLALIGGNFVAGLICGWVVFRELLPRAFYRFNTDSSVWAWSVLFIVGMLIAFGSSAYIASTKPESIPRWERFKQAWKASSAPRE